jgi:hypothetical protein
VCERCKQFIELVQQDLEVSNDSVDQTRELLERQTKDRVAYPMLVHWSVQFRESLKNELLKIRALHTLMYGPKDKELLGESIDQAFERTVYDAIMIGVTLGKNGVFDKLHLMEAPVHMTMPHDTGDEPPTGMYV